MQCRFPQSQYSTDCPCQRQISTTIILNLHKLQYVQSTVIWQGQCLLQKLYMPLCRMKARFVGSYGPFVPWLCSAHALWECVELCLHFILVLPWMVLNRDASEAHAQRLLSNHRLKPMLLHHLLCSLQRSGTCKIERSTRCEIASMQIDGSSFYEKIMLRGALECVPASTDTWL